MCKLPAKFYWLLEVQPLKGRCCGAPQAGESPLQMGPKEEESAKPNSNPITFLGRLILGTLAGSYYFLLPVYMWLKNLVWPKTWAM